MNSREQFELINSSRAWFVSGGKISDSEEGFEYDDFTTDMCWTCWHASRQCATPDWAYAPNWAQFLAMDSKGHWWWYAVRPDLRSEQWSNAWGKQVKHAGITPGRKGWRNTLEQRP